VEERGLASIKFDNRERAKLCKERMNGRLYYGKRLSAQLHDGTFKIKSKKADRVGEDERLEEFSQWIENDKDENL
jgi:RNA recognition motif-containing protein